MKAVLQRVKKASVSVENQIIGTINEGFLILLGIHENDTELELNKLCKKIVNLRVFADHENKMNLSLLNTKFDCLVVSQFTLFADCKKGNRPSFIASARPDKAKDLYEDFILKLEQELNKPVQTGKFGANMAINLCNDGPVTILLDTDFL